MPPTEFTIGTVIKGTSTTHPLPTSPADPDIVENVTRIAAIVWPSSPTLKK